MQYFFLCASAALRDMTGSLVFWFVGFLVKTGNRKPGG